MNQNVKSLPVGWETALYAGIHKLALGLHFCSLLAKNGFYISKGCKTKQRISDRKITSLKYLLSGPL